MAIIIHMIGAACNSEGLVRLEVHCYGQGLGLFQPMANPTRRVRGVHLCMSRAVSTFLSARQGGEFL